MMTRSEVHRTAATVVVAVLVSAACAGNGDRTFGVNATSAAPAEAAPPVDGTATARDGMVPASLTKLTAAAMCLAAGDLSRPGSAGRLLNLMSDDVVVVDTASGTELTGRAELRHHLESGAHDGVAPVDCGAGVQTDRWAATAYRLHDPSSDRTTAGIMAIRVAAGGIDRQVNHTVKVADAESAPPTRLEVGHPFLEYCRAWDDGADPDAVVGFLSAEPTLDLGGNVIVGRDAIRSYVVDGFSYVSNDCDGEVVAHGRVIAARHTLRTAEGSPTAALSIVRLDDDGDIESHVVHIG